MKKTIGIQTVKKQAHVKATDAEFMNKLITLLIGDTCSTTLPECNGAPNGNLDAPIMEA